MIHFLLFLCIIGIIYIFLWFLKTLSEESDFLTGVTNEDKEFLHLLILKANSEKIGTKFYDEAVIEYSKKYEVTVDFVDKRVIDTIKSNS